jgi:hypothetical protein
VSILTRSSLFANFLARFYEQAVCDLDDNGETLRKHCGAVRATPGEGTELNTESSILSPLKKRGPTPRLRVERGRCTDLAFPNAPEDDERKVVPNA